MPLKIVTRRCKLWAGVGFIALFCQFGTNAQTTEKTKRSEMSNEIIESFATSKVLNMVMPKTVELNSDITMALTVRVEPSFEEEFQYVFIQKRNGEIGLIKKRSASGNIYDKILEIEEQASVLTAAEMAKLINVVETRMSISPTKFKELVENLGLAVREHEQREAAKREEEERRRKAGRPVAIGSRDGTRYVIWMSGETKYDVATQGADLKSPARKDESSLIAWVRMLVKEF